LKRELAFAFNRSIPVLFGYVFLGIAFGLLLQSAGYNYIWALFCSVFVFAGSAQFALVGLLSGSVGLLTIALMILSINSRHIFYGLSFIEKFKAMGKRGLYMIFALSDETYSLLCIGNIPEELDEQKTMFYIAALDQLYWLTGSIIGALMGQYIPFDSQGVDFAMTALFVVIFIEQWLKSRDHLPAIIGAVCGVVSLLRAGPDAFILPALIAAVALILLLRGGIFGKKEAAG
jgi:4-azaleucine resistance transporter AzlC